MSTNDKYASLQHSRTILRVEKILRAQKNTSVKKFTSVKQLRA